MRIGTEDLAEHRENHRPEAGLWEAKGCSGRIAGYSETDPAPGGTYPSDNRISTGGVRLLARHSVADEVVGRRLRRCGHGVRFRGASAALRRRAAG